MTLHNLKKNLNISIENRRVILFVNNVHLFLIRETREGEILIVVLEFGSRNSWRLGDHVTWSRDTP